MMKRKSKGHDFVFAHVQLLNHLEVKILEINLKIYLNKRGSVAFDISITVVSRLCVRIEGGGGGELARTSPLPQILGSLSI